MGIGGNDCERIGKIGLGGNRASSSFWKVSSGGLKRYAAREGLDDVNIERMKKSNRHGSKYVLYLWAFDISRMGEIFCSSCKCSQTDRVYICMYDTRG